MGRRIVQIRLELVGEGITQFELIQQWIDVHSVEGASNMDTAVAIFEAGMGVYLKAMEDGSDC